MLSYGIANLMRPEATEISTTKALLVNGEVTITLFMVDAVCEVLPSTMVSKISLRLQRRDLQLCQWPRHKSSSKL